MSEKVFTKKNINDEKKKGTYTYNIYIIIYKVYALLCYNGYIIKALTLPKKKI